MKVESHKADDPEDPLFSLGDTHTVVALNAFKLQKMTCKGKKEWHDFSFQCF